MKISALLLSLFFIGHNLPAQIVWLEAKTSKTNDKFLFDHATNQSLTDRAKHAQINYNPSIRLSQLLELDLSSQRLNQCHILTVYKPNISSNEELIWQIKEAQKDQLLLTNERIADLSQGKFINFLNNNLTKAQINSYHHHRNKFESDKLVLCSQPSNSAIPVNKFSGSLAELIIFDRKLAPVSRQILESHLALKYSIPLQEGVDYLDPNTKPIWQYKTDGEYGHNIAGLGRSDELKFHQRQSKSNFGEGFLAFGIDQIAESNAKNTSVLHPNEYLVWSDNNASIDFEEPYDQIFVLNRKWKLKTERYSSPFDLAFQMVHPGIQRSLNENERLWLLTSKQPIDESKIEFTQVYSLQEGNNSFRTENIEAKDLKYFTFIKAPLLWMQVDLIGPECGSDDKGSIHARPVGGQAPYAITLLDSNNKIITIANNHDLSLLIFSDIPVGQYTLAIKDAIGSSWETDLNLNSSNLPELELPSKIVLGKEESIWVSANLKMDEAANHQWMFPDGSMHNTPEIELQSPGEYTLQLEIDNCILWHSIKVVQQENNIASSTIYPNPSTNGYFTFSAELKESTPYRISVSDSKGKLLRTQEFSTSKYITFQDKIPQSGTFYVTLNSGSSSSTEKLIIITE
ncbi:MAG: T9SS type A sorting domain-containing protein [Bacteroidota bacterium]